MEGKNFREISSITGVSLGAISEMITEERSKVPDIDELRELKVTLKQTNAPLVDALRGAAFLERLNASNVPVDRIPTCIELLNQYGEKSREILEYGQRLKELEESQGKTYEKIIIEASEKIRELEEAKKRVADLLTEEEKIRNSIHEQGRLKNLQDKLNQHNLTHVTLDAFIEQSIKLVELGFTPEVAEILAPELTKRGIDPHYAAATLTSFLKQNQSLESAVTNLQVDASRLQKDIETKNSQLEGSTKQLEALKSQTNDFKLIIKGQENIHKNRLRQLEDEYSLKQKEFEIKHQKCMSELNRQYSEMKAKLEEEIQSLTRKRDAKEKEIKELNTEHNDIQRYMDEAKTALEGINDKVTGNRFLAVYTLLTEEPQSHINGTTVLKASLSLLTGLKTHVEANLNLVSNPMKLMQQLDMMIMIIAEELRFATRKTE